MLWTHNDMMCREKIPFSKTDMYSANVKGHDGPLHSSCDPATALTYQSCCTFLQVLLPSAVINSRQLQNVPCRGKHVHFRISCSFAVQWHPI